MTGFSAEWLALREPADHRSRSANLARSLAKHLGHRPEISVVDLGSGTGSNLRATAEFLSPVQHWTLVDHDAELLEATRRELANWADTFELGESSLVLNKSDRRITVSFCNADLGGDLDLVLGPRPDLIAASALFDLVSPRFIETFVAAVVSRKAIFYTVLTYNGMQRWLPQTPVDDDMLSAFNRHQTIDKGFGPSAGPVAPKILAGQFRRSGYAVEEGDSPWELDAADHGLIGQLAGGMAAAVSETGTVESEAIERWLQFPRTSVSIGHTDTLAVP